ncbi:MAG: metallophosphoesterase [Clostridia bacterium]|nr:metallophosphoesterase [Clostridia bacterium]
MKKVISVFLSVLMIFSLVSVGVSAAEKEELKITVANDLHYNKHRAEEASGKYASADYSHVSGNGQLWVEATLIIDTFFAEFLQSDSDILLIPGDLVDRGTDAEHQEFSEKLAELEAKGKTVYVVPGNHDYYGGISPEQFASYYNAFGYDEAVAKDENSASYVAELGDGYRLLAVDSCLPGDGISGIDEERKAWIEEQAQQAQQDGKKLISMMHHNMLNHFIFGDILHPGGFVNSEIGLPELYAQYNVKYTLTGHTHAHDIKAYTGANGVTIYDILTSSLNLYPLPYRTIVLGDEAVIRTEIIETVDMTSKQGIISDNCYALATEDFQAYALECARYGLDVTIDSYVSASKIKSLLKLDEEKDADVCAIIDRVVPRFAELLDTPMYIKDARGGESLEAYANALNLDFTETDIKTFKELGSFFYQCYVEGDENYGLFSAEYILLTASLTVILNQVLAEVTAEDYTKLLNFLIDYFNLKSIDSVNAYAGDAISRIKGIDLFVSALGSSILLYFTTDELPADNNTTLPGYAEPAVDESSLSIFDRIVNFFLNLFNTILRIFGVGK